MDIIYINDLHIETIIGIYAWERKVKQTITLDVEMGKDIRQASASNVIGDTIDYSAVADNLRVFVGNSKFELLETLAEEIAQILLNDFKVGWLRLRVNKRGAVQGARDVGIIIERQQP